MDQERIRLEVPTEVKFANVVRVTAATLAASVDLTIADVEDVRIAAEEGFVYAVQTSEKPGCITIDFIARDKELTMEFSLGNVLVHDNVEEPSNAYAAFILGAVCDEYEITESENPLLRLVKRMESFDVSN